MRKIIFILMVGCLFLSGTSQAKAASLVIGEPADYVIITSNSLSPALDYYVYKKTEQGYKPRVFSVEDIYVNYPGAEQCEQIKNFIKEAFDVWGISYVLLVGEIEQVPSGHIAGNNLEEQDNYYVLLDGATDVYQDLYIGRLPAANYEEILAISSKWADYNTHGWGRTELCLSGNDYSTAPVPFSNKVNNHFDTLNWQMLKMDYTSPSQDIIDAVNFGYGLINWGGHGWWSSWWLSYNFDYTYQHAYQRTNGDRLSFINALYSCLTGKFSLTPNIAKNFIRAPEGGAIGYIGANKGVYGGDVYLGRFYANVERQYLENGYVMPGVAFHDAIGGPPSVSGASHGIFTYNLLGDPTAKMDLLPESPDTLTPQVSNILLSSNNIIVGQSTTISVTITDNDAVGIVKAKITMPDGTILEKEMECDRTTNVCQASVRCNDTAQEGLYQIQILAKDISQNQITADGPGLTVLPDKEPPVITGVSITPEPVYQKQVININILVTDNAGFWELNKWAEITKPNGETVRVNYGSFDQTEQVGLYNVVVYAQDYSGNKSAPFSTSFEVLLDAQAPAIKDYWVSMQICGASNIAKISSVDTPGTKIHLYETVTDDAASESNIKAWAEVTKPDYAVVTLDLRWQGGSFPEGYTYWGLAVEQIGTYSIVYYAQDQSGNKTQTGPLVFQLTGNNLPPEIILPQEIVNNNNTVSIPAGKTLSFIVSASDPNGNPVTLSIWSVNFKEYNFDTATGEFKWTTKLEQVGTYSITFAAKDNHPDNVKVYKTVTILVGPPISMVTYGDVSGDGEVSAFDAALTARIAVGLDPLGDKLQVADVSGDGEVSAFDAALIAQYSVGLIDRFPVEP